MLSLDLFHTSLTPCFRLSNWHFCCKRYSQLETRSWHKHFNSPILGAFLCWRKIVPKLFQPKYLRKYFAPMEEPKCGISLAQNRYKGRNMISLGFHLKNMTCRSSLFLRFFVLRKFRRWQKFQVKLRHRCFCHFVWQGTLTKRKWQVDRHACSA